MKKNLVSTVMLALGALVFFACSDSDDEPLFQPQDLSKTYAAGTSLYLTYSGTPVVGKSVSFQTDDSRTATLTLNDVIPGEAQTVISGVVLTESDGKYVFSSRTTRSAGAAVEYSGSIADTVLNLNLEVTMPDAKGWSGAYGLSGIEKGTETYWVYARQLRGGYKLKQMTKNTILQSAGYVEVTHFLPEEGTLAADTSNACFMTTLPALLRGVLGVILPQTVDAIALEKDGNIVARYSSDDLVIDMTYLLDAPNITPEIVEGLVEGRTWLESPRNLAYWYEKNGDLYVKLNVAAILAQAMKDQGVTGYEEMAGLVNNILSGDAATLKNMLSSLPQLQDIEIVRALTNMKDETFVMLMNWIKNGIPLKVSEDNGHTRIYLDRPTLAPIMAEVPGLLPLLENTIPAESYAYFKSTLENGVNGFRYTSRFDIGLDLIAR